MGKAVKILNDYEIKMLATTSKDIDYNNFYKEELIRMIYALKKQLKTIQESVKK